MTDDKVKVKLRPPFRDVDRAFYGEAVDEPKKTLHCPACGRTVKKDGECKACRKAGHEAREAVRCPAVTSAEPPPCSTTR